MFASIFRKLGVRRCFSFWMFHNWSSMCTTHTAQKWSFPLRISSVNTTTPQEIVDFVTFTEEILNRILHFLCSDTILSCLLGGSSWRPSDRNAKCTVTIYISCCNTNTHPNLAYEKSIGSETKRSRRASQIYPFLRIVSKFCIE